MAIIGNFTLKDGKYTGKIHTLTLNTGVSLLPNTAGGADAPAYRVFAGKSELGAAWEKRSEGGRDYLSVKLDDPTFATSIYAGLFEADDGTFNLIWSRSEPR